MKASAPPASRDRGFTFVEVVVVLVIAMLAVSVVGPGLIRTYDKIQAQSELKVLTEVLSNVGYSAFLAQAPRTVKLEGKMMLVAPTEAKYRFAWLAFPEVEVIRFNSRGFPDRTSLRVEVGEWIYNVSFPTHVSPGR